jgi:hypothetical protein
MTPPASATSPSPSVASRTLNRSAALPTARKHPLAQGSVKEINLIHYLDDQLQRVFRRYEKRLPEEKRTAQGHARDDAPGYENMEEVIADLDPLVDVVWITHTRECTLLPSRPDLVHFNHPRRLGDNEECWYCLSLPIGLAGITALTL